MREYQLRRAVIALTFLFIVILTALIFLVPSYIVSSSKKSEVSGRIEAVKHSTVTAEATEINADLVRTNLKIQSMVGQDETISLSDIFEIIIANKDSSIRINGLEYRKSETGEGSFLILGVARDRENLSRFIRSLESEESFTKVDIPVSNFAQDKNASFSITINGKF